MATIRFTHGYDLLHKIGNMVGGLTVFAAATSVISPIADPIERALKYSGFEWIWVIILIAYFLIGYAGSIILINKTIWPSWLPTFLYVRITLHTPITGVEAEKLSYLFDGSLGGKWYPLNAIKKIEAEYRKEALFRFANKVADDYRWVHPFEMPEDHAHKEFQRQRAANARQNQQERQAPPSGPSPEIEYSLKILGLDALPSNFDVIKQAYRRKIREFHPDKFVGEKPDVLKYAEETAKRINSAYAYLEQRFAGTAQA